MKKSVIILVIIDDTNTNKNNDQKIIPPHLDINWDEQNTIKNTSTNKQTLKDDYPQNYEKVGIVKPN